MAIDTSPRTYRFLPADVLAMGYRVVGKIMVSSTGAIGMLNDPTHSILEVHDAHTARLSRPTEFIDHFEMIRVVKARVNAVCLPRREDLGPQALVRGGYTSIVEYPVRIATHMFEIEGIVEFPGRFDFATLMTEGSREFIPLSNATMTGIFIPDLRAESGGMLINRRHIDLIALLNQRVKQQKP